MCTICSISLDGALYDRVPWLSKIICTYLIHKVKYYCTANLLIVWIQLFCLS